VTPPDPPVRAVLDDQAVDAALAAAPPSGGQRWHRLGGRLVCVLVFPDFPSAVAFVDEVARLAQARNHHPDIDIRYRTVTLGLVTHDAGGLTDADLELARAVDGLVHRGHPPD
jgi:4a-hydroxytetrahydrobiopterin dehydratase